MILFVFRFEGLLTVTNWNMRIAWIIFWMGPKWCRRSMYFSELRAVKFRSDLTNLKGHACGSMSLECCVWIRHFSTKIRRYVLKLPESCENETTKTDFFYLIFSFFFFKILLFFLVIKLFGVKKGCIGLWAFQSMNTSKIEPILEWHGGKLQNVLHSYWYFAVLFSCSSSTCCLGFWISASLLYVPRNMWSLEVSTN